jgi:hypothetical protein
MKVDAERPNLLISGCFFKSPTTSGTFQQSYSVSAIGGAVTITSGGNTVTGIALAGSGAGGN